MKTSKSLFAIIFVATAAISCSKDAKTPPAQAATPLVKQLVITYPYIRSVYNNTYDDQKLLATVGNANHIINYNAGGFEISQPYNADKLITDVTLDNSGRIGTVLSYPSTNERYNSIFSYDTKGRLAKIVQTGTYYGRVVRHLTFIYTWDDNDNLLSSRIISDNDDSTVTYSGFSAENENTLKGSNFGFDYFGTADYPSDFVPNDNGGSGVTFPSIYAGKILPTQVKGPGYTRNLTYHKNAQGYIDRIETNNPASAVDHTITDIAYQ